MTIIEDLAYISARKLKFENKTLLIRDRDLQRLSPKNAAFIQGSSRCFNVTCERRGHLLRIVKAERVMHHAVRNACMLSRILQKCHS